MKKTDIRMSTQEVNETTHRKRRIARRIFQFGLIAVAAGTAIWVSVNVRDSARLSGDTRVVVRFPKAVFASLTNSEIREEFPILEQSGEMEVTGDAVATGQISIEIEPDSECHTSDHAMIAVRVVGETEKSLIGQQSNVRILGTGRGQFEAVKRIHFDGRKFRPSGETIVEATHETEIDDVETPVGGAIRLLASRRARQAVPDVNLLAIDRIKERVGQRIDEIVEAALLELNLANRFQTAIARLHPSSEEWRIQVTSNDGYVQAALVPQGGQLPELPWEDESEVEVWMRLTSTQRMGVALMNRWQQTHRLLSGMFPEEKARQLAEELDLSDVEEWTRVIVTSDALGTDRA